MPQSIQPPDEVHPTSPLLVSRGTPAQLEPSISDTHHLNEKAEDWLHKDGTDDNTGGRKDNHEVVHLMHSASDTHLHDQPQQCDPLHGALRLDEFTLFFKAIVASASSLLEAGEAGEQGRVESPWVIVNADGSFTLEPHGAPSSVQGTSLVEEEKDAASNKSSRQATSALRVADFVAAVIAASSLGAGALLLARMAAAASR